MVFATLPIEFTPEWYLKAACSLVSGLIGSFTRL
jgi:hypothetical protein